MLTFRRNLENTADAAITIMKLTMSAKAKVVGLMLDRRISKYSTTNPSPGSYEYKKSTKAKMSICF